MNQENAAAAATSTSPATAMGKSDRTSVSVSTSYVATRLYRLAGSSPPTAVAAGWAADTNACKWPNAQAVWLKPSQYPLAASTAHVNPLVRSNRHGELTS